eukprot:214880-Prymnesium_polylepis.1
MAQAAVRQCGAARLGSAALDVMARRRGSASQRLSSLAAHRSAVSGHAWSALAMVGVSTAAVSAALDRAWSRHTGGEAREEWAQQHAVRLLRLILSTEARWWPRALFEGGSHTGQGKWFGLS